MNSCAAIASFLPWCVDYNSCVAITTAVPSYTATLGSRAVRYVCWVWVSFDQSLVTFAYSLSMFCFASGCRGNMCSHLVTVRALYCPCGVALRSCVVMAYSLPLDDFTRAVRPLFTAAVPRAVRCLCYAIGFDQLCGTCIYSLPMFLVVGQLAS